MTDRDFESVARENQALKTWVVGILAGCEGCTSDATQWAAALGLEHGDGTPSPEVAEQISLQQGGGT